MKFESILANEELLEKRAREVFKKIDVDDSGSIDKAEMHSFMVRVAKSFGLNPPSATEISEALDSLDDDQNGELDFDELRPILIHLVKAFIKKGQQMIDIQTIKYNHITRGAFTRQPQLLR